MFHFVQEIFFPWEKCTEMSNVGYFRRTFMVLQGTFTQSCQQAA
jgi:hypothetical protein